MQEIVYFLRDRRTGHFKIGMVKTGTVEARIACLRQKIDVDESFYIVCDGARRVEIFLHERFKSYRFNHRRGGSGCSEWFSIACFRAVLDFVKENQRLLRCSELIPLRHL